MNDSSNKRAPDGKVYVCLACGKTADWFYGFDNDGLNQSSFGWDVSCVLNCDLFDRDKLVYQNGRVVEIKP